MLEDVAASGRRRLGHARHRGDAVHRGRPRRPTSRSCSATRPTACRPALDAAVDDWVSHPDGRARRVAQRRDGRHAPLLRGAPAAWLSDGRLTVDRPRAPARPVAPSRRRPPDRRRQRRGRRARRCAGPSDLVGRPLVDVLDPRDARRAVVARRRLAAVGRRSGRVTRPARAGGHACTTRRRRAAPCGSPAATSATTTGALTGARARAAAASPARRARADRRRGRVDREPRAAVPAHLGQGLHVAAAEPVGPPRRRAEEDDARAGPPRRRPGHPPHHRAARHQPARDRPARAAPPARRPAGAGRRASSRSCTVDLPGPRRAPSGSPTTSRRSTPTPTRSSRCSPTWSRTPPSTPARPACASRAASSDDAVAVAVTDHGEGIPAADLPRVFTQVLPPRPRQARPAPASGSGSAAAWSRPTAAGSRPTSDDGRREPRSASRSRSSTSTRCCPEAIRRPTRTSSENPRCSTRSAPSPTPASPASAAPPASTSWRPSRPSCSGKRSRARRAQGEARRPRARGAADAGQALNEARARARGRAAPGDAPSSAAGRAGRAARGRAPRPHRGARRTGGLGHLHLVTQAIERPRGRVRRPGLHRGRGPRGRDRLAQLRRPQLPARPPGPRHVRHALRRATASRARRCCAPTRRRCRCG